MSAYDVAIIGAGVVGAAIARELSRYNLSIAILDKENDVCCGASKANSAIVHAGYDPEEGTLMARFNLEGAAMYESMCRELSVPYKVNGALVVALDDEQIEHIHHLKQRGGHNGVPRLEILATDELLAREPAVNPEAKGALWVPTSGIVDPMLLTISLVENAVANGAECILNFDVCAIEHIHGGYNISSKNSSITAGYVINAAGVNSDKIHNMVSPPAFRITPKRGQYFMLDKTVSGIVSSTIFPCPSKAGKGMLVAPTVHGNAMLGPSSDNPLNAEDLATTEDVLDNIRSNVRQLVPNVRVWNCIRTFSGMRAEPDTGDFIIGEASGAPGFIDVAGIKSPGLTAAPAIALHVVSILETAGLTLNKKSDFNPILERKIFNDMPTQEQEAMLKANPMYGRIICRCENVSEGDILDAIKRSPGATTVDGVKRRCRAGMGRCQGGFCGPKVQHILARELSKPLEDIIMEKNSSYILTGKTK